MKPIRFGKGEKRTPREILESKRRVIIRRISAEEAKLSDLDRRPQPIRQSDQPELCKHNAEQVLALGSGTREFSYDYTGPKSKDCKCDRSCYCRGYTCER